MVLALDELHAGDNVFNEDGLTFIINKQLFELAKPITIDSTTTYKGEEFSISSSIFENTCAIAENIYASLYTSCAI